MTRRRVTVTLRFCVKDASKVQRTANGAARWIEAILRNKGAGLVSDRIKVEVVIGEGEE